MRSTHRVAGAAAGAFLLAAIAAHAASPRAGAYCPLPSAGEVPECLEPARTRYGEFFAGVEQGRVGEALAARVERDLAASARGEQPYLALSSLAYAYYRLSRRAAESPNADPALVLRLTRWNRVLTSAYANSEEVPEFRASLRDAALDLRERAPSVALACRDAHGSPVECQSTAELIRAIEELNERSGIRGALARLLGRFLGSD